MYLSGVPESKDSSRRVTCRPARLGALAILPKIQVMSSSDPEAMALTDNNGVEISIPSTPSDEMSTDVNRRDLALDRRPSSWADTDEHHVPQHDHYATEPRKP